MPVTNQNFPDVQRVIIDDANPNDVYIGYADPSTLDNEEGWIIKRIQKIAGIHYISFANNNTGYTSLIWDNRATYSYTI